MATQTEIVNMALLRLGETRFLSNITTDAVGTIRDSRAIAALLIWETERQATLRDFNWPFARKYALLTLESGTVGVPANPDAIFQYQFPTDALFVRRLVTCEGQFDCSPPPYKISKSTVSSGRSILTNLASAMAEYTVDVTDITEWDESFTAAFILRIAMRLAPGTSRMTEIVQSCQAEYQALIAQAVNRAAAEAEYTIASGAPNPRIRDIFNRALTLIGVARNGVQVDPELNFIVLWPRLCFEEERDTVMREFAWPFAKKYATLEKIAGDGATMVNHDWAYAYRLPADCLFARRITTAKGKLETDPPPFERGRVYAFTNTDEDLTITMTASTWTTAGTITLTASEDLFIETEAGNEYILTDGTNSVTITVNGYSSATVVTGTPSVTVPIALRATPLDGWTRQYLGPLIFTNWEDEDEEVKLEYTRESTDPDEWDADFFLMLSVRVGAILAPGIAKGKNADQRAEILWNQYRTVLSQVQQRAGNEAQPEQMQDAEWHRDR